MLYEITVTLKPTMYGLTPTEQYKLTKAYMREVLEGYQSSCVAELTQEQNVHYHCMVKLDDVKHKTKLLNRFRKYHQKVFGRKSCTQVCYENSYKKYMAKDLKATQEVLGLDPVVTDAFGVCKTIFEEVDPDSKPTIIDFI